MPLPMTDRPTAAEVRLDKLIETVEANEWDVKNFPIDAIPQYTEASGAFHGSLDAAKALHDALLPGWSILLHGGHHGAEDYGAQVERVYKDNCRSRGNGRARTLSRAWLLATLRAYRAAQEQQARAVLAKLQEGQSPLGAEFGAVWDDNQDKLYES